MYLQFEGSESTSVTQKWTPNQHEQYGGTVHLFIGTGYNPYKITYMPFTFGGNSKVIYRGLNGLFIFKSVPFSANMPKLSCFTASALCQPSYLLSFSLSDTSPKIPVHTLYSRNTVKSCFWGPSEAEGPQQDHSLPPLGLFLQIKFNFLSLSQTHLLRHKEKHSKRKTPPFPIIKHSPHKILTFDKKRHLEHFDTTKVLTLLFSKFSSGSWSICFGLNFSPFGIKHQNGIIFGP
jgi:hypothetical protein